MSALSELIRGMKIDIVILEPIITLFTTKDENDNTEAALQSAALVAISRETGAAVVGAHHTGKETGGVYGRGASARLAGADVGITFRARGDTDDIDDTYTAHKRERNDVCQLRINKDRPGHFGHVSLYMRMVGNDSFSPARFVDWKNAAPSRYGSTIEFAKSEIMTLLEGDMERSRNDILTLLKVQEVGRNSVDRALSELAAEALITVREGDKGAHFYRKVSGKDAKEQNSESDGEVCFPNPGFYRNRDSGSRLVEGW
jgi:hypothetical protein